MVSGLWYSGGSSNTLQQMVSGGSLFGFGILGLKKYFLGLISGGSNLVFWGSKQCCFVLVQMVLFLHFMNII